MTIDYRSQTVLLTGASAGIGAAFATALASRGANLVLVARRADQLTAIADELHRTHGVRVDTIPFDLADPAAGAALHRIVTERGIAITSVINNEAVGTFALFADADAGRLATEIAVDVAAPVQVTAAFLPDLLRAGNGFILNVAGASAYVPSPRMAVYSAAKAFVLSFTESLWAELRGSGLTVFAVSPGATRTEFTTGMGTGARVLISGKTRAADDVVATALAHLERRNPGPSVVDGRINRLTVMMSRFATRRQSAALMARVLDPARL
ncbi:SDR family NAD(P)-dependent oxidoreductase [Catenuloplanes sp. NPDC051500]|uniref:SDR family NAD(P)-dependent oxidoreductase n=1 Tax=Catenuloplanes sp. NPDC051500 TaxID=3363959 RepID=UPI0037B7C972